MTPHLKGNNSKILSTIQSIINGAFVFNCAIQIFGFVLTLLT